MSTWLRLLNEVKNRSSEGYLTNMEKQVCHNLVNRLSVPGKTINLFGPHGCGKTVVAWVVASLTGSAYLPHPSLLRAFTLLGSRICIVDNVIGDEMDIRRILSEASLRNIEGLLIITNLKSSLRMETISLPAPSSEDIRMVLDHYARWGYFANCSLSEQPNFWQVMQACS